MIKQLLLSASLTSSLLMTGCMSTGPDLPEPVEFNSEREYQWEEDKSFALNIAQMGKFAGVGIGNEDSDEPMTAGNNIPGMGSSVLNTVAGFGTGGLLGAFSMSGLSGDDKEAHMWPTSFMSFIPVSELEGKDEQTVRKIVQTHSSSLIKDAITKTYPNAEILGDFSSSKKSLKDAGETIITYRGDYCLSLFNKMSGKNYTEIPAGLDMGRYYFFDEKMKSIKGYCNINYTDIIAGTIDMNGSQYYIVVSKTGFGQMPAELSHSIKSAYEGGVLISQMYHLGGLSGKHWINKTAHVWYKGQDYYFDVSETSSKDQL